MAKRFEDHEITVQITDAEHCTKDVCIEIAPDRFKSEKERVLRDMAKEVSMPGFRKGKVPQDVVERRFAEEIHSEAIKSLLPLAYEHVVASTGLEPISDPHFHDVKAEEGRPVTFTIHFEVAPRLAISDYRGIKVEKTEPSVTDEEIDEVVKSLQQRAADYEKVERAAAAGDIAVLDFGPVGLDGAVDEAKRVKSYPVQLGSGQIFPEFEQGVTGKKAEDTGTVEIQYPADYEPERLAGRKVAYKFVVREVRERRVPELGDAFAAKIDGRFKTMADLRADVRQRLIEEKEKEEERRRQERAVDLVLERNRFDIPASMVARFKEELAKEDEERRRAVGVGPEEDEERKKQISELFDRVATRNIKRYFLFEHIAEKERVDVTSAEIDAELEKIAADSGEPLEEIKKVVKGDRERMSNLRHRIFERKIFEIILGTAGAQS
jgi:trigger factor